MKWNSLPTNDEVDKAVGTRQRKLTAPLQEFLLSRADAGATQEDVLNGMEKVAGGNVIGKFFHMYPKVPPDLFEWMTSWMKMGAVLVALLNLQNGVTVGEPMPDAWHHQMIYGVVESGVFTLNPHEFIPFPTLIKQLCSESVIKIKAQDVIQRWQANTDLSLLSKNRWAELNVTQAIHRLVYLVATNQAHDSHVTIPAAYKSGITVFCTVDSDAGRTLLCKQ